MPASHHAIHSLSSKKEYNYTSKAITSISTHSFHELSDGSRGKWELFSIYRVSPKDTEVYKGQNDESKIKGNYFGLENNIEIEDRLHAKPKEENYLKVYQDL